jgi:hypothetical protein
MKLDITSLGNAARRLREGLARYQSEPMDEQLRDGLIQRFEFTYELSHKMLRRYLKEIAASADEVERMPFADLIRTGSDRGLLRNAWPVWRHFAKCALARATLTTGKSLHRSWPRSRPSWKKASTSTRNCNGGSHDATVAHRLAGGSQAAGA